MLQTDRSSSEPLGAGRVLPRGEAVEFGATNGCAPVLDGTAPEPARVFRTDEVCPTRVWAMLAENAEREEPEIIRTIIIRIL